MNDVSGFRDTIAGWVHESARSNPVEALRHETFIWGRLLAGLVIAALVPPYLALRGAPALWEILVFVCTLQPLISVVMLSRTGNLLGAHLVSTSGFLLASMTVAAGMGGLSGPALIWLALAPLEAILAISSGLVLAVTAGSAVAFAVMAAATALGIIAADARAGILLNILVILPAIVYAAVLAHGSMKVQALRQRLEQVGAARYDTLVGAIGDLLLRHDRTGAVLYASRESETLFGLAPREMMGRGVFERIFVQDRPAFLKAISDACNGAATVRCEFRLRIGPQDGLNDDPVFHWVEMRSRPLMIAGRTAVEDDGACAISILRDISREKAAELDREQALAAADRANAWKDRFLANFSHELRTPLNAIIGFSEILSSESLMPVGPEKQREYAGIINASGQHLLSVVNAILDMSKIEAGRFDITAEPFDLAGLMNMCCDMMRLKAEQSQITLDRFCPDDLPELVADKRACKQILLNLLSNAVKFTGAGGQVRVAARLEGRNIAIEVTDTGIGITERDLPRIGDAFFQAGDSYDRPFEGTGLGLSVVRGLVGLHGGTITVSSNVGEGTSIRVRLPLDCRATANQRRSATIEVLPLAVTASSISASKVKKIA